MSFFNNFRFRSSKRKNVANSTGIYQSGSQNSSSTSLPSRRSSTLGSAAGGISAPQQSTSSVSKRSPQINYQPLFLNSAYVRAALVKGSFQTIVELPKYVDLNEWLALNIFEFNSYLTQFCSTLSEFITPETCPTMNAGPGYDYLWIDNNRQPIRLPASTYIEYTLSWISSKFDDQTLFPTRQGVPFPPNFTSVVKGIYVQLFRIFAHIYHTHFDKIVHLSLEPHWNSFFCHFISFGKTYNLIDRTEMAPLASLIQNFEAQQKIKVA
ncbi:CBK1 kinase activator protein MOB2 [Wickerhamiella sorbophila]|uniref:CBK1 kinase activator protein MOB2 n=1 Tax=Wickerhamiella sorbophila TaxID=45607 RepID=A0A2T0FJQ5_9ASCO|nr:CBK1 kinase activator protein MOB2 [Wickerhamiella sorbophila]PRT55207.1 CBK1 kinase activator protein MOB2 [Wickerhamiella sorbophila]